MTTVSARSSASTTSFHAAMSAPARLCIMSTFGSVASSKDSGSYSSRNALACNCALWNASADIPHVCQRGHGMREKRDAPGLGYESGGYAPFFTHSLSIHLRAAALAASVARNPSSIGAARMSSANGSGMRWNPGGSFHPPSSLFSACAPDWLSASLRPRSAISREQKEEMRRIGERYPPAAAAHRTRATHCAAAARARDRSYPSRASCAAARRACAGYPRRSVRAIIRIDVTIGMRGGRGSARSRRGR